MTWTANKPTSPGVYWVWMPHWSKPGAGDTEIAEVTEGGGDTLWVERMGRKQEEVLTDERWAGCMWLGPIEAPAAPGVSQ